ncbi:DUF3883 domain-containing protein [Marinobacterium sp. D7]|uniref:DUF3883 domain-containing protein n=1 Tax=Marinobacterium ramblicola TaxID=2849041 RepID=UPI001C2CE148|nr:DUF3883 domain-containing protein [Marinobacterium ramblicola]MBV1787488.1 DUF3883 domain-containing protein [Marinobacterium ramblicola]
MANNWSESEVEAAVEDYFDMLRLELLGHTYNKTEHRRTLLERLNNRSHGSVELKHQNISAVLIEMGIPYIEGYKPRTNYQKRLLPEAVASYLSSHPDIQLLFQQDAGVVPAVPTVGDLLAAMEAPPQREERRESGIQESLAIYNPGGINYLELEAQNQLLGDAGEQFIINYERARLIRSGCDSLADSIAQVSVTEGPMAGFDIRSFEVDGRDRFIEVKTTKYGKNTPFYVTPNELAFSRKNAERYFLYRLFRFRTEPRVFALQGHLQEQFKLQPSQYLAKPY